MRSCCAGSPAWRAIAATSKRAAASFASSLDAVESQSQRLGGSHEVRTAYAGQRRAIYLEYVDVLVASASRRARSTSLERFRARALLMMLAERTSCSTRTCPPI